VKKNTTLLLVLLFIINLLGCVPASKPLQPEKISLQKSDYFQGEHHSYPIDVSIGKFDSTSLNAVDVELNIIMEFNLTKFGKNLREYVVKFISNSDLFIGVSNTAGSLYITGELKNFRAANIFGGARVSGDFNAKIYDHYGGTILWETTIKHEIFTDDESFNKFTEFKQTLEKSFNKLSMILAKKFVSELGVSSHLVSKVEKEFDIDVKTITEKADLKRKAFAKTVAEDAKKKAAKVAKEKAAKIAKEKAAQEAKKKAAKVAKEKAAKVAKKKAAQEAKKKAAKIAKEKYRKSKITLTENEIHQVKTAVAIELSTDPNIVKFGKITVLGNQHGCVTIDIDQFSISKQMIVAKDGEVWLPVTTIDGSHSNCVSSIKNM